MIAPKPSGISNTKAGKTKILERTKTLVENSSFIMNIPIQGVTKEQVDMLKKELPKGTKASVVKNSLFRLSVQNTGFSSIADKLRDENMFIFIQEGEAKKVLDGYKRWQKEVKRTDAEFDVKSGAMEGMLYVGDSLEKVVSLPSKKELITKIAQGIKAVPLKLAKGVKAVPTKVGVAINLVKNKMEEDAKASA